MAVTIAYKPTPKQLLFHASPANEVLFGGAAGGGKTRAIVMDALMRCLKHPGTTAAIFRRTYAELEDTDIREARSQYPAGIAKYNSARHEYQLANGSRVLFRHCENEADRFNYSGIEVQFLYFDELTSFEQSIYDFLKSRMRAKKSLGVVPLVRSASNPGNIGHGWVKAYFVDAGPYMSLVKHEVYSEALGRSKTVATQYIPSLAKENPHIGEDYIFELERKPEALRRALLCGDWDSFEGQVFAEFVNDPAHYGDRIGSHVIEPFEIPLWWPRFMGYDFGYSKPFSCLWFATDPEGRVYLYREWYGCRQNEANVGLLLSPREIAEGILLREKQEAENNLPVDRLADPACWDKSRGDSVIQQMEPAAGRSGVFFRRADNTRMAGLMQMHERLRFDAEGRPMFYVFSNCREWIRTVPTLPYSTRNPEDVDTAAEDHCVTGDTRVCTRRGDIPISKMAGKTWMVMGHDRRYHRAFDVRKTQENVPVFKLETECGNHIRATANHRFYVGVERKRDVWKRLDELKPGDKICWKWRFGSRAAVVKSITPAGQEDVYNMEVKGVHSFIANGGFVAHNCYDATRYFLMSRPIAAPTNRKGHKRTKTPFDD